MSRSKQRAPPCFRGYSGLRRRIGAVRGWGHGAKLGQRSQAAQQPALASTELTLTQRSFGGKLCAGHIRRYSGRATSHLQPLGPPSRLSACPQTTEKDIQTHARLPAPPPLRPHGHRTVLSNEASRKAACLAVGPRGVDRI